MILKDEIQAAFNRIQYEREIKPEDKTHLTTKLSSMEKEYEEFFGEK